MSKSSPIQTKDHWFKGEDKTFRFPVTNGDEIKMDAAAAENDTSLTVDRLDKALSSGAKIRFDELVVTLSAPAVIGARTIAVDAIAGFLARNQRGEVVEDVTGFTLEWVLRESPSSATAILTSGVGGVTVTAPTPTEGVVEVFVSDQDTIGLAARNYYHTLRRTDSGSEALLAFGPAALQESAARD